MLLGRQTPVTECYAPELLYPISRAAGREQIAVADRLPLNGTDLWHAYEMSWLDAAAKPVTFVGRFAIPASSPNMVESKSFKLYLNSLNNTCFESTEQVRQMADEGFTMGSHTLSHYKLVELDQAGIERQIVESSRILPSLINMISVRMFSISSTW